MVRPAIVPFRWTGHGLDLHAYLDPSGPLFYAEDVCRALRIDVPYTYNHRTGRLDYEWPAGVAVFEDVLKDGVHVPLYRVEIVARLGELNSEFLTWFETVAASLTGDDLARAIDTTTGVELSPHQVVSYTASRAAAILTKDPSLTFRRDELFTAMHLRLEWIHRMNNIWIPTSNALRAGYLVRQPVYIAGIKSTYPQIRITHDGLHRLHALLGGTAPLDTTPDSPLTLVEPS